MIALAHETCDFMHISISSGLGKTVDQFKVNTEKNIIYDVI